MTGIVPGTTSSTPEFLLNSTVSLAGPLAATRRRPGRIEHLGAPGRGNRQDSENRNPLDILSLPWSEQDHDDKMIEFLHF